MKISILLSLTPNILTVSRIVAAPVLILLLKDSNFTLALVVFVLAGISDGLDGWIAKRFNCTSQLGARMDPLADKIIIVSAYVMLVFLGLLPFWLVTLVIFRDLVIVGGYMVLNTLEGEVNIQPTMPSKLNTVLQLLLVITVLTENTPLLSHMQLSEILIYAVAISTLISGLQYLWIWVIRRTLIPNSH